MRLSYHVDIINHACERLRLERIGVSRYFGIRVWRKGQFALLLPKACIPAREWLPITGTKEPMLHTWLLSGQITRSPKWGKGPGMPKGIKAKHAASTHLDPPSSWGFSHLKITGTHKLVVMYVLFYIFSVFFFLF